MSVPMAALTLLAMVPLFSVLVMPPWRGGRRLSPGPERDSWLPLRCWRPPRLSFGPPDGLTNGDHRTGPGA
jgi:hypothetical protein